MSVGAQCLPPCRAPPQRADTRHSHFLPAAFPEIPMSDPRLGDARTGCPGVGNACKYTSPWPCGSRRVLASRVPTGMVSSFTSSYRVSNRWAVTRPSRTSNRSSGAASTAADLADIARFTPHDLSELTKMSKPPAPPGSAPSRGCRCRHHGPPRTACRCSGGRGSRGSLPTARRTRATPGARKEAADGHWRKPAGGRGACHGCLRISARVPRKFVPRESGKC